jgi:hypothetical protein
MKLLPVLILLCLFYNSFAQSTPNTDLDNTCEYKTDGTGKSLGLKIKINYPCSWQQSDGQRPHRIKNINHGLDINSGTASIGFSVYPMPTIRSNEEIDEMLTQDYIKESVPDGATLISGRKIKIDGLNSTEVEYKIIREMPLGTLYTYNLVYNIYYKDKLILVSYGVGSSSNDKALAKFEEYKTLFKALATMTIIISQWE